VSKIEHKAVTSSFITSVGHDPVTRTMEIKFKSGNTYAFPNVSATLHVPEAGELDDEVAAPHSRGGDRAPQGSGG
jgi:hypothetical protein